MLAINQLPKIAARAKSMLKANRATLNQWYQARDGVEVVPTNFGTTSFPRLPNVDVEKLCKWLLEKSETAVVPGRFFESPQYIRIGMCCDPELFSTGIERVGKALDELSK